MEENTNNVDLNDESIFRASANLDDIIKKVQEQEEILNNENADIKNEEPKDTAQTAMQEELIEESEETQKEESLQVQDDKEKNTQDNIGEEPAQEIEETQIQENNKQDENEIVQEDIELTKEEEIKENGHLKKYIFYVSKDFTQTIDEMSIDERTAYINDAIQMKIDSKKVISYNEKVSKIITQAIVVFLTVCLMTPIAIFIMNKAIMATFDNYKYSQENFEKLYKQRFEKDKAYMRSVQYNQLQKQNAAKNKEN